MNLLAILRTFGVTFCALALGVLVYTAAVDPDNPLHRVWSRYCASLESLLYRAFVFRPGHHIAIGQCVFFAAVAVLSVLGKLTWTWTLVATLLIAAGPTLVLKRNLRARIRKIDGQVEGFIVATANALKSRPSVGDALESVMSLTPNPLRQELELAVKQMRFGSAVELSLLHMSARVGSKQLDTALSALLIGRQVGGNLPTILETTGAAMREMERLEGVVRTKTAEGKAQMWVLAFFPFLLMLGFNAVSPGYFDSMSESVTGYIATGVAFTCWGASIVIARGILAVDI